MKLQDCFIGQNVGVNSKSMGVITTRDNEGLINQEKVDKSKLPIYITQTVDKLLSDWEKSK